MGSVVGQVLSQRLAGMGFGRIDDTHGDSGRTAFGVVGPLLGGLQVGEAFHAAIRAGAISILEVPALRGLEVLGAISREPVANRVARGLRLKVQHVLVFNKTGPGRHWIGRAEYSLNGFGMIGEPF